MKYIQGDLVKAAQDRKIHVLGHQSNCFCTEKSGIAPLIIEAFPAMKEADRQTKVGDRDKLGTVSHAFSWTDVEGEDPLWGFNLYGQYHHDHSDPEYGVNYEALTKALIAMRTVIKTRQSLAWPYDKVLKVGFPLIGCGHAGGDWGFVEPIINHIFCNDPNIEVYIYTLEKLEGKEYVNC